MRKIRNILLGFALPLALIVYIVLEISPRKILETLCQVDPLWLSLGLGLYVVNYVFRSIRFRSLVHSRRVTFRDMFKVGCFHSLYNYMLPARAGEFSYVVYLNRITGTPTMEGLSTLLVSRVMDFISVILFFPLVILFLHGQVANQFIRTMAVFVGLIVSVVMIVFYFVICGQKMIRWLEKAAFKLHLSHSGLWKSLRLKLVEFHESFAVINTKKIYFQLLPVSLLVWLSVYGTYYTIIRALHVNIGFWHVVLLVILMIPTRLLPLQGFGDLGSHEVGWVLAFRLFGSPREEALLIAFNSHILILLYVLVVGLYAIISTRQNRPSVRQSSDGGAAPSSA